MSAQTLLVSVEPGGPPAVSLFARPAGPWLEICLGEPGAHPDAGPDAGPEASEGRPLFAWRVDGTKGAVFWKCQEKAPEGSLVWREPATGASVELFLDAAGLVVGRLKGKGWSFSARECSAMLGPMLRPSAGAGRDDLKALHPALTQALEAIHPASLEVAAPFLLAADALALRFETPGAGVRFLAPLEDDEEFRCAPQEGDAMTFRLGLNFSGRPAPASFPDAREVAPALDLPSLGVEWGLPEETSAPETVAWAEKMAEDGWPGGTLLLGETVLGALDDVDRENLLALGFEPRRREESASDGQPENSLAREIARTALQGLRPSLAEPARPFVCQARASEGLALGEALAVGAFAPRFRVEAEASPAEGKSLRERLPAHERKSWMRAASLRMAFLPYLAHLRERELREGLPMVRPLGLAPEEARHLAAWRPHFLLGEDVLVAGPWPVGGERFELSLPPGEWLDYYDGSRFAGHRPLGLVEQPLPGRILLFFRAGSILPLFDLGVSAPFATGYSQRPGPGDALVLKIAPRGEQEREFYDVFAPGGSGKEKLVVAARLNPDGFEMRLRAQGPRRLTLILRHHRPARILAGTSPRDFAPLPCLSDEAAFASQSNCWHYHIGRDELLVKIDLPDSGRLALKAEDPV